MGNPEPHIYFLHCYGKTLVTDEQNAAYLLLYGCEDWMAIAYDLITELRKSFSKRP